MYSLKVIFWLFVTVSRNYCGIHIAPRFDIKYRPNIKIDKGLESLCSWFKYAFFMKVLIFRRCKSKVYLTNHISTIYILKFGNQYFITIFNALHLYIYTLIRHFLDHLN